MMSVHMRLCVCYTEKATNTWHRQERQTQWHNQNHQQTNQATTKQPTNNIINLCTNHPTHHTQQPTLHPHEQKSLNAPAQYPASDPSSSKAKTKCTQQHSNQIAHAHAGTSNPQPSRQAACSTGVTQNTAQRLAWYNRRMNKAPPETRQECLAVPVGLNGRRAWQVSLPTPLMTLSLQGWWHLVGECNMMQNDA